MLCKNLRMGKNVASHACAGRVEIFFTFIQQTSNWLLNGWYEYEWNDVFMEMKIAHLNACKMCKVDNDEVKLLLQHLTSTLFYLT